MLDFVLVAGQLSAAIAAIAVVVSTIWLTTKRPVEWVRAEWAKHQATLKTVAEIKAQLQPNGGQSLRDEIDRQGREQRDQSISLIRTGARLDAIADLIEKPVFQTDEHGRFISVNQALCTTLGYPAAELLGMGFVTAIEDKDRDAFMQSWEYAIRDRRAFRRETRVRTRANVSLTVRWFAQPTMASAIVGVVGWTGAIEIEQVAR